MEIITVKFTDTIRLRESELMLIEPHKTPQSSVCWSTLCQAKTGFWPTFVTIQMAHQDNFDNNSFTNSQNYNIFFLNESEVQR